MSSSVNSSRDRVIIFTRYPVPGKTKTRLIPELGPAGAADLHRKLTENILDIVKRMASEKDVGVEIRFDGGSKRQVRKWLGTSPVLMVQEPGNLGERMHAAFFNAFHDGCRKVVLIGTDIPQLTSEHLIQAFDILNKCDVVLGPSKDGGYWLIGLKDAVDLYQGINWGEETVLEATITLAKEQGLRLELLEPLKDIDTIEDIPTLLPADTWQAPYLSVVIPTFNEELNIEATIHSARDKDSEIIVVDGGSTDRTVYRAFNSGAQVVISPPGRAIQQNRGAYMSRGRILLFLHADTLLPKDYVILVFETLMAPRSVGGAFRFKTDFENPLMRAIEAIVNIRSKYLHLPYGDQGLFFRKSVFEDTGGFPEVPIAEDLFLVRRISKQGRMLTVPAYAVTSSRRWRKLGLLRNTLMNILIMTGCLMGVSPQRLAALYRILGKTYAGF